MTIALACALASGAVTQDDAKRQAAEACYNRGMTHCQQGKFVAAVAEYTKAIELDPTFAKAYCDRGVVLRRQGNLAAAIADYTKAIELDPKFAGAYNNRAIAYYLQRKYDKAWADVKACQKLGGKVHPRFLEALRKASGRKE